MDRARSTTIGILVLVGGAICAMMFRAPTASQPEAAAGLPLSASGGQFAVRIAEGDDGNDVVLRDESTAPAQVQPDPSRPADRARRMDPQPKLLERPSATTPPSMPSEYGGLLEERGPIQRRQQAARMIPPRSDGPRPGEPSRQEHKVRDGDRLDSIALRYYGDAGMAEHIYAANRHILPSRNLLPLHTILKLPTVDLSAHPERRHPSGESNGPQGPNNRTRLGSVR